MTLELIMPDSAGLIYPYVRGKAGNAVFRIEAELCEDIDFRVMRRAVADLRRRFPTFFVKLVSKNEMFMLAPERKCAVVVSEPDNVCTAFDFEHEVPLRITVHKNRVALEIYHMLADGHGALIFMKTLLVHYYNILGCDIAYEDEVFDPLDEPSEQEISDAFLSVYRYGRKKVNRIGKFAYQYRIGDKRKSITLTLLKVKSDEIRFLAKRYDTTVGILLTSVYIYSFYRLQRKKSGNRIKISVPVDLRSFFPNKTVRNFSLYTLVGIAPDKDNWNLEKIIAAVTEQMKNQVSKEGFTDMAYTNVSSARTLFFRRLPLPVKKRVLRVCFDCFGERLFTSTLSNMGNIELPEELREHVKDIRPFLGEAMLHQVNAVASAYAGYTNIVFSSRIENSDLQRMYERILNENGIFVERLDRIPGSRSYTSDRAQ